MAISPEVWDDEARGRVRDGAVFFPIVLLGRAVGIRVDDASGWVAQGEPWFYLRLGGFGPAWCFFRFCGRA